MPNFERLTDGGMGTSLIGYVTVPYATLVATFGEPSNDGDGYKVDAQWVLKFEDGTIATIYNYKDGKNYCGAKGRATSKITEWHIGGKDEKAALYVCAELPKGKYKSLSEHQDELRKIFFLQ